jgi:dTDP-4-amino-4,6-dideoxygalactose transaminase
MHVPFVDLYAQYEGMRTEIDQAISDTIRNTSFIGGQPVREFESAFAQYLGINHVIGCANGTDSLEILLQAMGIGPGDEVIVPAHSWISTAESVSSIGARPVFVDTEPNYFTIDVEQLESAITTKTKAIIPVHLYGHPADMPLIMQLAEKHGLKVIEDCAQAHGAEINGKMVGTFGDAASFSFYPGKNLGAYGDAGAMVTNDDILAEKARMIANHGQITKHHHRIEGRNSRLDGLQAAILLTKLPYLPKWTELRMQHASAYHTLLKDSDVQLPQTKSGCKHVFHLYVIRTQYRDALKEFLAEKNIETAIHYPTALPYLECYLNRNPTVGQFSIAQEHQSKILSIPMFAELSGQQIEFVANGIKSFLPKNAIRK